jgi:glycosyltransferase involved in cell wall biosynthesis
MALQCRIVASDTAPIREVLKEGETGRLFPFFDEKALVERVGETLADPERSTAMAQEARRQAIALYDYKTACLPRWRELLHVPAP